MLLCGLHTHIGPSQLPRAEEAVRRELHAMNPWSGFPLNRDRYASPEHCIIEHCPFLEGGLLRPCRRPTQVYMAKLDQVAYERQQLCQLFISVPLSSTDVQRRGRLCRWLHAGRRLGLQTQKCLWISAGPVEFVRLWLWCLAARTGRRVRRTISEKSRLVLGGCRPQFGRCRASMRSDSEQ
jgi:hypothetical protein